MPLTLVPSDKPINAELLERKDENEANFSDAVSANVNIRDHAAAAGSTLR